MAKYKELRIGDRLIGYQFFCPHCKSVHLIEPAMGRIKNGKFTTLGGCMFFMHPKSRFNVPDWHIKTPRYQFDHGGSFEDWGCHINITEEKIRYAYKSGHWTAWEHMIDEKEWFRKPTTLRKVLNKSKLFNKKKEK